MIKTNKKALFLSCAVLLGVSLYFIFKIENKLDDKRRQTAKIQTLPTVRLFAMDSLAFQFPPPSSVVLIHFNTGCEHCQYELKEIKKNLSSFAACQVVLMSPENISDIRKASAEYGLADLPNIHFTKINPDDVFDTFGSLSVPHIFIYGQDRKLIKEFKGETKVEAILQHLK